MTIRMGLVGVSNMTPYHLAGYRLAGAEIVGVADPNGERAAALAEKIGARAYPAMEAMLAGEKPDAVTISTPNRFHAPLTLQALEAGLHVFCEKPPALNAIETRAMRDAARRHQRTLMFNMNNRFRPETQALMNYIQRGEAGRINSAQAVWMRRNGIPGFGSWYTNKALAGGGPVMDLLHMVDLALWFMGFPEPEYVLAQTFDDFIDNPGFTGPWGIPAAENPVTNVENAGHGFVRFKTGQVLTIHTSWAEMVRAEEVVVSFQGTKAGGTVMRTFDVDGRDATAHDYCQFYNMEHGRQVNRDIRFLPDETMGRNSSAENFILALEGKTEPRVTPDQAVILMEVLDAVYASAASGAPVKVS